MDPRTGLWIKGRLVWAGNPLSSGRLRDDVCVSCFIDLLCVNDATPSQVNGQLAAFPGLNTQFSTPTPDCHDFRMTYSWRKDHPFNCHLFEKRYLFLILELLQDNNFNPRFSITQAVAQVFNKSGIYDVLIIYHTRYRTTHRPFFNLNQVLCPVGLLVSTCSTSI